MNSMIFLLEEKLKMFKIITTVKNIEPSRDSNTEL